MNYVPDEKQALFLKTGTHAHTLPVKYKSSETVESHTHTKLTTPVRSKATRVMSDARQHQLSSSPKFALPKTALPKPCHGTLASGV